jgi:hypothetical protein
MRSCEAHLIIEKRTNALAARRRGADGNSKKRRLTLSLGQTCNAPFEKVENKNPAAQDPWPGKVRTNLPAAGGSAAEAVVKTKPRA